MKKPIATVANGSSSLPSSDTIERLHRKYAPNSAVYELVFGHCTIIAEIALWCASNIAADTEINEQLLQTTALLHDIGSYAFFDTDGKSLNHRLYPQHAILGSKLLTDEGINSQIPGLIETHILLGLTKEEIIDRPWPLPERNYEPTTIEGELLC